MTTNPKRLICNPEEARRLHAGETVEVWRAMKPQPKTPVHVNEIAMHSLSSGALGFYDDDREYYCPFPINSIPDWCPLPDAEPKEQGNG